MLTIKLSISRLCNGILVMAFLANITGCSANLAAMRQPENTRFIQEITRKSSMVLPQGKRYNLDSCIQIALENNLDLRISEINSRLARLNKNIAFSNFLPQVDISATWTDTNKYQMHNAGDSYMAMSDQKTRVAVIKGQLAVFTPETWFLYSAYKKGEDIQGLVTARVRQLIRLQVTALYLSNLSLESGHTAAKSAAEQADTLLKEMEALYKEEMVIKSELEKARAFNAAQQNNLTEVNRQMRYARAELLEAMGLYPLSEILLDAPPPLSIEEKDLADMILNALLNRPELMAADLGIEAKGSELKMAISAFLPRLFLVGDLTSNRDSFLKYRDIFTYGASGILSIFDGFANIYKYKAAKQEKALAMAEREQACLKIMLEVINAKHVLDREEDNRNLVKLELYSAESYFNEVISLWNGGMVTSSKKLEATTNYTSAKSNMELANYRYQVAAATMADVMGLTGKE
ncbi:MAG: TolC family protein [Deltaproteobacteria bacterium]|nr:TolC family protein [Deltaproteobacteria bacterium]